PRVEPNLGLAARAFVRLLAVVPVDRAFGCRKAVLALVLVPISATFALRPFIMRRVDPAPKWLDDRGQGDDEGVRAERQPQAAPRIIVAVARSEHHDNLLAARFMGVSDAPEIAVVIAPANCFHCPFPFIGP